MCKLKLSSIEKRFLKVTKLKLDLSVFHIDKNINSQQETQIKDVNDFGFVTTPLWLVDKMIQQNIQHITQTDYNIDLCAGCGQFTIRLLRKLWYKYQRNTGKRPTESEFELNRYLEKYHYFSQINTQSVAKLLYIFGNNINVFIGDSRLIDKSNDTVNGLLLYDYETNSWVNDLEMYRQIIEINKGDNLKILIPNLKNIIDKYVGKYLTPVQQIDLF